MESMKTMAAEAAVATETDGVATRQPEAMPVELPAESDGHATGIAEAKPTGNRFRGWYSNKDIGYQRLTDEIAKLIVLKFDERPSEEVVARVKEAGFRYRPQYFGQQKVWTRPNNFEGREQVGKLEAFLTGLSSDGKIPF
jgi:hypothetical protein